MSRKPYPSNKDSGIEWLGCVPDHWPLTRLRFVARLNPSRSELAGLDRNLEVSFLPMEAIGEDGTLSLERTRPIGEVETGYSYMREGDVVLAKITPCFENGKGAIALGLHHGIAFGTTELIVARPRPDVCLGRFLHWLFVSPAFRKLGEASMYGAGGQKRVPDDFVRDFRVAFPPLPEQLAIAAFLDRETAKIDALVAEQERLIALLAEKRRAVISHAVTKGLDPNAPMKDSGIAWLGEIPAHWEVKQLKWIVTFQRGHDLPSERRDEGNIPIVSSGGVTGFHSTAIAVGPAIVTGRYGSIGEFDLVIGSFWPLNTALYSIDLHGSDPRFALYLLRHLSPLFKMYSSKSAVPGVDRNDIHTLASCCPPLPEQAAIADWIEYGVLQLDTLTTEAERAITLLKGRRAALISAAVTGKIDVRDAVDTEEVAA